MAQKYGHWANREKVEVKACLVCDDPSPTYSWTDFHGEAYCVKCGTSYQLKGSDLKEGETAPRCNLKPEWIPICRRYFQATGALNGSGRYFGWDDYPEQLQGLLTFNNWCRARQAEGEVLPASRGLLE